MATKERDRLFINKSDRKDYEMLLKSKDSPFLSRRNKVPFVIAMLFGVKARTRTRLKKKDGWIYVDYLNDDEESIIKAIAVFEAGDLNVLLDKDRVYTIAEEYAATGIKLLKAKVFSGGYGTFAKKLESDLITLLESKVTASPTKAPKKPRASKTNPLLENAMHSLANALEFFQKTEERHRQATLVEMDQAVEYALKALLFQVDSSKFMGKDWAHLTYDKALKKVEELEVAIPNNSLLRKAHSARNKAQHRGVIASASWTRVHLQNVFDFLKQFCAENFQLNIEDMISEELLPDFSNSS